MKKLLSLLFLSLIVGAFAIGCAEKKSDKPAAPAPGGGAAAPAGAEKPAGEAAKP